MHGQTFAEQNAAEESEMTFRQKPLEVAKITKAI
jgi:hypothetical protein